MARREIEPGFRPDTFSTEFKHYQMGNLSDLSAEIGVRIVAIGLLVSLMSLVMNPGEFTSEVQNFGIKTGEAGLGIIAFTKGIMPVVLAGIRMAAVEAGLTHPYDPIARGCTDCLQDKNR